MNDRHASGSFMTIRGRKFLVTARHCLSGRDAFHDDPMDRNLFEPHKIRVFPSLRDERGNVRRTTADIILRDDDNTPQWLEDPEFRAFRTDIACVEIPENIQNNFVTVEEGYSEPALFTHTGSSCFVVGFPSKNFADPYFPIWRRGAIASEPRIPIDNKPIFLIDAMTSPGMSGSLVVQREFGPAALRQPDGSLSTNAMAVVTTKVIGVYGGRVANSDALGDIGYCWYENRIRSIAR
ncbi:S1 family peptidase [Pseudooceanicola marinus]|nr:serine protease [Pseudooceanicola marinus]PJE27168.1 serine protease [Pseudooceanicola marinus]